MNLTAKKPVHINGGWVQAGQPVPYDVTGFNYEDAARRGLIESEDGEDIVNPEGSEREKQTAGGDTDLTRLQEQHAAALKVATDKASEWERRAHEESRKVTNLTKERDDLVAQRDEFQGKVDTAAADAEALAEYREVVGELLPGDFPARKILLENGYYTVETVQAASDDELNGLKGISDAKLADIRKVAPYSSGE